MKLFAANDASGGYSQEKTSVRNSRGKEFVLQNMPAKIAQTIPCQALDFFRDVKQRPALQVDESDGWSEAKKIFWEAQREIEDKQRKDAKR
jgi:hypothetical protein